MGRYLAQLAYIYKFSSILYFKIFFNFTAKRCTTSATLTKQTPSLYRMSRNLDRNNVITAFEREIVYSEHVRCYASYIGTFI